MQISVDTWGPNCYINCVSEVSRKGKAESKPVKAPQKGHLKPPSEKGDCRETRKCPRINLLADEPQNGETLNGAIL